MQYYIIINGRQAGPFELSQLPGADLTPMTPVWHEGMPDWMPAAQVPEVAAMLNDAEQSAFGTYAEPLQRPLDPHNAEAQAQQQQPQNNWQPQGPSAYGNQYGQQGSQYGPQQGTQYGQQGSQYGPQPMGQPYGGQNYGPSYAPGDVYREREAGPVRHTDWLPWAIVGTIMSIGSCIGLIFGILGIVNASKANRLYMEGYRVEGDAANSTARTMTIITLVLAGLTILSTIFLYILGAASSVFYN